VVSNAFKWGCKNMFNNYFILSCPFKRTNKTIKIKPNSTMKTIKTIFVAVMSFAAVTAAAQSADDIVNKHIAALGGADKLATLKTVKMEGNMNTQGIDVALTLTKKHLTGMRMDMEIMGTSNYQMATATKGWVFMPIMQQTEPQEMDPEQLKSIQGQLDIQGTFLNYKAKGYSVEYLGTEKVDGKDAFKLKVVKEGKDIFYYIDAVSNFIVKTTSKANVQGQEMDVETTFADYKQNADGYWFSYTNTTMQGVITFDKISTNVAVDDKLFTN
jgi:hypothetical protein